MKFEILLRINAKKETPQKKKSPAPSTKDKQQGNSKTVINIAQIK